GRLGPIVDANGRIVSPVAAYASILPAVQNLLLAARALGLGTTLTTLHAAFEAPLRTTLAVPSHLDVVALVPPGHPRARFGPTRGRDRLPRSLRYPVPRRLLGIAAELEPVLVEQSARRGGRLDRHPSPRGGDRDVHTP